MKSFTKHLVASALVVVAMSGLLAGCSSSSNYKTADSTGTKMSELADDVQTIQAAVATAKTALDAVVQSASTDPRKAFEQFSKSVKGVENAAAKADKQAAAMRDNGQEFFAKWQEQMVSLKNEEMKQLATDRKAELEAIFKQLSRSMLEVQDKLRPWLNDIRDIQTYLGNDLTARGIEGSKKTIVAAQASQVELSKSVSKLVEELGIVRSLMAPASAAK